MFLKYRIMKHLKFDEPVDIESLHKEIHSSRITLKNINAFGEAINELGREGFISHDENGDISLYAYSSFHEYKAHLRKAFFEIAVTVSAIVVAVTSVISVFLELQLRL